MRNRWDPATQRWVELPDRYRRAIVRAKEMGTRLRPIELITLPLGRIAP